MGQLIKNKIVIEFDLYEPQEKLGVKGMGYDMLECAFYEGLCKYLGEDYKVLDLSYKLEYDPFLEKEKEEELEDPEPMKERENDMGKYDSIIEPMQHIEEFEKLTSEEQNSTIMNPGHVDEDIWGKAKEAAAQSGHAEKWPLVMYLYEKMGGK